MPGDRLLLTVLENAVLVAAAAPQCRRLGQGLVAGVGQAPALLVIDQQEAQTFCSRYNGPLHRRPDFARQTLTVMNGCQHRMPRPLLPCLDLLLAIRFTHERPNGSLRDHGGCQMRVSCHELSLAVLVTLAVSTLGLQSGYCSGPPPIENPPEPTRAELFAAAKLNTKDHAALRKHLGELESPDSIDAWIATLRRDEYSRIMIAAYQLG